MTRASVTHTDASSVTTYDVLKTVAVILMIIDHLGYCFFPDESLMRAVGRICVPIWLFLIGYAQSRRIDPFLIGGALLLLLSDAILDRALIPTNILCTIIIMRLTIQPLMARIKDDVLALITVTVLFLIAEPFIKSIVEYGGVAFILGISGYIARRGFDKNASMPLLYAITAAYAYIFTEQLYFNFTTLPLAVMTIGVGAAMASLLWYLPKKDVRFSVAPAPAAVLRFVGRHTLEIYVLHLIAFKFIKAFLCGCIHCSCHLGFDPLSLIA